MVFFLRPTHVWVRVLEDDSEDSSVVARDEFSGGKGGQGVK